MKTANVSKRLFAALLAVLMFIGMLPFGALSFTAQAADAAALQYRMVHLDCGRKYFSVDYIKGVIDTMYENGFNQLELAFGNGGLRFVLDNMDIVVDGYTLHDSAAVKAAIKEGNESFYNDPNGNSLNETEMKEIISYAQSKKIEIVPLLNMPGHMDALLSSSLFSQYKLKGSEGSRDSEGSLDLNNSDAVGFGKALLKLYVDWFALNSTTKFFNFGADEYGQGIRNPYIESGVATVTYDQLIAYMNDCAGIIEAESMTARCFNDFVCYNRRSDCNLYKTVQVCYWSNQWNGSEYNTPDAIKNAGYKMINTNQKWYYVPSKADEYGKSTVLSNFSKFDVTKYQNIKSGYNSTSTTYTEIPVGSTNVGAMFAVWCDEPSVDVALADVQELIAAMADANPTYFTKNTTPAFSVDFSAINYVDSQFVMKLGESYDLSATDEAEWTSSNDKVISLSAKARALSADGTAVTASAVGVGTAELTATSLSDRTQSKSISVTVNETGVPDKMITVVEGQTETVTITGKNLSGTYTTDDETVATVKASCESVAGDTISYQASATASIGAYSNNSASNLIDGNTSSFYWSNGAQTKGAYVQVDLGAAIPFEAVRLTSTDHAYDICTNAQVKVSLDGSSWKEIGKYTGTSTPEVFKLEGNVGKVRYIKIEITEAKNNWWQLAEIEWGSYTDGTFIRMPAAGTVTTDPVDKTTLTFTGKKAGTTFVVIDGVKYIITVTEEQLQDVLLPINLWITNTGVVPTGWSDGTPSEFTYTDDAGNRRSTYTLKATYGGVYSENGIELSGILPSPDGKATSWDGKTYDVTYWKSAYHSADVSQSTDGWTNNSHKGIQFTYIRYWDHSWAYSADGIEWVNISDVSAAADNPAKNQVNIWYRQKTEITDEVRTEIVDWGPITYRANQCLLDFAVKYETGDRTPDSFPVSGKTVGFDCPTNQSVPLGNGYIVEDTDGTYYRTVYGIAGVETSEYEVYMITVTPSSDSHTTYITKGSVPSSYIYGGTEKIAWAKTENDAENSDLAMLSGITYGGEPFLESVKIYQYQGLLVTYYVRAKATPDSLAVHYIERSGNTETEFYGYNISVSSGTVFDAGFAKANDNPADYGLINNTVTNINGKTQTVNGDLKEIPEIAAQYRYTTFKLVEVNRDSTGKEVFLYYTFDNEATFVIDFGLPLTVSLTDINQSLSDVEVTDIAIKGAVHGKSTFDISAKTFTYTLTEMLDEIEILTVNITEKRNGQTGTAGFKISIIPASIVYYEDNDSFITFDEKWEKLGADDVAAVQAVQKLGNTSTVYGYDAAYANNSSTYSNGGVHKVTLKTGEYATATFSFKGTGFDLINLTGSTTGTLVVSITNANGYSRNILVDTYYGHTKDETGKWIVDSDAVGALHQIPGVKVDNLPYGEYTVEITAAYNSFFDHQNRGNYELYIDAVRIYNPLGDIGNTYYAQDGEGWPKFEELRDLVISAGKIESDKDTPGVIFIDGDSANGDIDNYNIYGPKNELYLAKGHAIAFYVNADDNVSKIELALSSANGREVTVSMPDAATGQIVTRKITSSTELYYAIPTSGHVIVTNTGSDDAILSITNIKTTYKSDPNGASTRALFAVNRAIADKAVANLNAILNDPEVFTPEYMAVSVNRSSVREGGYVTVTVKTSADVAAVTVNGIAMRRMLTVRGERLAWTADVRASKVGELRLDVVAANADGIASETITETVTVTEKIEISGILEDIFKKLSDRWFR